MVAIAAPNRVLYLYYEIELVYPYLALLMLL